MAHLEHLEDVRELVRMVRQLGQRAGHDAALLEVEEVERRVPCGHVRDRRQQRRALQPRLTTWYIPYS